MPTYSRAYDAHDFDPAMPIVDVTLLSLATGEPTVSLLAAVDSGADATMLPVDALEAAGALYMRARRLRGVAGHVVTVDTYLTIVQAGPHIIRGVEAVALPSGDEVILGRDVLNQLTVTLNGPAQELWLD